jgi:sigma-B regulation protein RsbU (phosphoserine phosphatase)
MATLVISGPGGTRNVSLDARGAVLGREAGCDIVLDHTSVSRHHARIFRDPFGRWIIEDLESQNGVFAEGERVGAHAIVPGEQIGIRPFNLSLVQEYDTKMIPRSRLESTVSVLDEGHEDVIPYVADREGILSAELIHQLNEITGRLLELQSPAELYREACYCLARLFDTFVAFVRLPGCEEPLPNAPEILACNFGLQLTGETPFQTPNLHLSRRVLDAVRSTRRPVMARGGASSGKEMALTIMDEQSPHAVFSAPVSDFEGTIDALYLDILENRSPQEMFDFVEAVARQIGFAQKSLILSEARAERRILDRQLALAHDIQARLIPQEVGRGLEIDVGVCYEPAMWVGGDYCDVWRLENGRVAFAVGDVSGKGLPAAMIMSNLQAALRTTMTFCSELSNVAEYLNRHLCENLRDDMFVTLFLGLFDPVSNELAYVNAGHLQPVIKEASGGAKLLGEPANPPLGLFDGSFEMFVEPIEAGAGVVVITDGITEATSPEGELFETDRLLKLVAEARGDSAQGLVQAVAEGAASFRQKLPPQDDITVLALLNRRIKKDIEG